MKSSHLFCLAAGLVAATARAQPMPSPDEAAVWRMEFAWNRAYVAGDAAQLAALESAKYVYTESDGTVHTRADEIAEAQRGEMHFTEMSLHEASVRITGDTAIVTGRLVVAGGLAEKFGEINESTDTLVRENGAWKAVASVEVHLASTARSAIEPLWRDGGNWLKRHEEFVAEAKHGGVDLLFVGDSITDFWRTRAPALWQARYGKLRAANLGISGDRTQHVLWRLDHGEVDGLNPKVIVLMIGTNNTGLEGDRLTPRNSPAEAAEGVAAVVSELRKKLPAAKILLLAVFPRSHLATDPARLEVAAVNQRIAGLDDGHHVRYLDIGSKFLTADGTLEPTVMPDYLHPNARGYEIWAEAMQPTLDELLAARG
jgi:lysophospholipase L1-like esterase